MGIHYREHGDLPNAESHFAAAAGGDPADAAAAFNLGRFLAQVGRTEEGRVWLLRALTIDPNQTRARTLLQQLDAA